jgi:hypothetical protein
MVVIDNKLACRIKVLADKNHKSFNQQLEAMVETFEVMSIHRVFNLPGGEGCHSVPVIEVSGQAIEGGQSLE